MRRPVKCDLLRDDARLYRVLWCEPGGPRIAVLDINRSTGWPEFLDLGDVLDDLEDGVVTYEEDTLVLDVRRDEEIPSRQIEHRDTAWRLIEALVKDEPAVYQKAKRCARLTEIVQNNDIAWNAAARYLQLYWRRGMTKNALLPRFSACGAPGRKREDTTVRRGRPRRVGFPLGANITEEHKRCFSLAIRHHYAKNRKLTLVDAHKTCLRLCFSDMIVEENGQIRHVEKPEFADIGFPTYGQFKYLAKAERFAHDVLRQRETPRVYEMKRRGLPGSTTREAWGPGSRYQIDATVVDLYLVSSRDPKLVIGRPIIYVVIDAFSRLITGLYVGLEGPSYVAAMMALANAAAPKKAYCAQFGIDIEEEDWPVHHLPSILLADRGELAGIGIENALQTFGVLIENAPPYRGDWKGLVESQFRTIHSGFKAYTPGYVEPDFQQRGARDYRTDAVLDLEAFTKIIIDMVLVYNRFHVLRDYERHTGLTEDGVLSIPLELWRWGIANISGPPKARPPEQVRFALMRTEQTSVTRHGIRFRKMYYTCDTAISEGWLEKARAKSFKITISYDDRDASRIYVHTPKVGLGFDIARLAPKSIQYDTLSGWDVAALRLKDDRLHAHHEQAEQLEEAGRISRMEQIVEGAKEKLRQAGPVGPAAKRVRDIRPNRAREKAERRINEAMAFRPDADQPKPEPGVVVPFSPPAARPVSQNTTPRAALLKRRLERSDEQNEE